MCKMIFERCATSRSFFNVSCSKPSLLFHSSFLRAITSSVCSTRHHSDVKNVCQVEQIVKLKRWGRMKITAWHLKISMTDITEFTAILELMCKWSVNRPSHSSNFMVIYRNCCEKLAIEMRGTCDTYVRKDKNWCLYSSVR